VALTCLAACLPQGPGDQVAAGVIAAGLAVAAVAAGMFSALHRAGQSTRRLAPYRVGVVSDDPAVGGSDGGGQVPELVATVASAVERAIDGPVQRSGIPAVLAPALVRSNLNIAAVELAAAALVVAVAVSVGLVVAQWPLVVAVALGVASGAVPTMVVVVAGVRRRHQFIADLPDALQLLAGTLRAGFPLVQALAGAATDLGGPVAAELRRVSAETALGRELPEALRLAARRMGSDDLAWVAVAVDIHQQAGGNLAEVLDTVAHTVTERARLRREVASLTAEGRLSAIVLGLMPPVLAGVITVVNPGYLGTLASEPGGVAMVIAAAVAMVIGFVWMYRIVSVDP